MFSLMKAAGLVLKKVGFDKAGVELRSRLGLDKNKPEDFMTRHTQSRESQKWGLGNVPSNVQSSGT